LVTVEVERQSSKETKGNKKEEIKRLERADAEKPNNEMTDVLAGEVVEQRAREEAKSSHEDQAERQVSEEAEKTTSEQAEQLDRAGRLAREEAECLNRNATMGDVMEETERMEKVEKEREVMEDSELGTRDTIDQAETEGAEKSEQLLEN